MAEYLTERKRALLTNQLRHWFGGRNRSEYVDVRVSDASDEVSFLVIHGRTPRSLGVITSAFSRDRLCIMPDREDTILFERATGKLSINAQYPADHDFYRRALGLVFFEDDRHFEPCSVVTGAPLLENLEEALSPEGIAGLDAVGLRAITLESTDRHHDKINWTARDLRPLVPEELPKMLGREKRIIRVKLALYLRRYKRPKLVELLPPNKMVCDWRTGEDVVLDFLFTRGYLRLPEGVSDQKVAV
jgi:hypothetical protein